MARYEYEIIDNNTGKRIPMGKFQPDYSMMAVITIAGGAIFLMSVFNLLFPYLRASDMAQWIVAGIGCIGGAIVVYYNVRRRAQDLGQQ